MTTGPAWGTDKRTFPKLAAWLQNLATFKSAVPPPFFQVEFLGIRAGIPLKVKGEWKVLHFRLHVFRWDSYAKIYIFMSCMLKRVGVHEVLP